jgi:hypothetical protein
MVLETKNVITSNRITEEGGQVTLLTLGELLLFGILAGGLVETVAAGILAAQIDGHDDGEDKGHDMQSEQGAEARIVPRLIAGEEEIRRHGSAEVAEADVHGNTDTTLERAANVVAVPSDTLRDVGVDTRGHEEAANVAHRAVLGNQKHYHADNSVIFRLA